MLWALGSAAPAQELPEPEQAGGHASEQELPTIPVRAEDPEPLPEGATVLEPIEVTGSRIRRTDYETAQPILVITREDIDRTGLTSIGDILQNLPIAGSAANTQVGWAGTGAVNLDLRHLGSNRLLVLVNGHRWITGMDYFNTGAADFTTIPISVIERVEVLKDSASAVYGSDAITGVVNIITRKDYHGAEFRTYAGLYDAGDGLTQSHNLSFGEVTDTMSLFLDLSYARQDGLYNADRDFTRVPVPGAGNSRGSAYTPQGYFGFVPTPETQAALENADADGTPCPGAITVTTLPGGDALPEDTDPRVRPVPWCDVTTTGQTGTKPVVEEFREFDFQNDRYLPQPLLPLLTPSERTGLFGQFAWNVTRAIRLTSDFLYNQRRSQQAVSPEVLGIGDLAGFKPNSTIFVDRTNPFNPFEQDIGGNRTGTQGVGSGLILRRMVEQGRRTFSQDVDTYRGGVAVSSLLNLEPVGIRRTLDWEVGYAYAQGRQHGTEENILNYDHIKLATGPGFVDSSTGEARCGTEGAPIADCVPLNLFGGQRPDGRSTITPEQLQYIDHDGHTSTRAVARDAYANFRTELLDLPAGPLALAFGAEVREEDYAHVPDPLVTFGNARDLRKPTEGGYGAREMYAELGVPIAHALPLVEALELSLAGRYSDFARFGTSRTGKVGLRWKPMSDLLVRGTYGSAFRTPSVTELFLGADVGNVTGAGDPCTAANRRNDPDYEANCAADGATPAYSDAIVFLPVVNSGNPDLEPEAAQTVSAGIVYSPHFLPDFNLNLDWYRIEVEDFIFQPGFPQFILDACYRPRTEQRAFCDRVHRNSDPADNVPDGNIEYIHVPFLNMPHLETEGLDISFDYRLPALGDFGVLKLLAGFSYLSEINLYTPTVSVLPGRPAVDGLAKTSGAGWFLGYPYSFPRWKGNAALDWRQGLWSASWSTRYIHHIRENCVDGGTPSLRDLGQCSDPDPVVRADDPDTPTINEFDRDTSENVMKATFYHDLQIGRQLEDWDTTLSLGINNLLDQDPPRLHSLGTVYSYDPTTYDLPGRFAYVRLQKNF